MYYHNDKNVYLANNNLIIIIFLLISPFPERSVYSINKVLILVCMWGGRGMGMCFRGILDSGRKLHLTRLEMTKLKTVI